MGIDPGKTFDPNSQIKINGKQFRERAEENQKLWLSNMSDKKTMDRIGPLGHQPKGITNLESVLSNSIIGPIGIPQEEAVYPQVLAIDGKPINTIN